MENGEYVEEVITDEIDANCIKIHYNNVDYIEADQQEHLKQHEYEEIDNSLRPVYYIWLPSETDFLLQRYNQYIGLIKNSIDCSIKTQKDMWQRISDEMKAELNVERTVEQIRNRYKTLMRNKRAKSNFYNKQNQHYYTITEIDDTDNDKINERKTRNTNYETEPTTSTRSKNVDSVSKMYSKVSGSVLLRETLLEINEIQEVNRDRRHREMMQLWRDCLTNRK